MSRSAIFAQAHKDAKKQKAFYGANKTYRQLLGELLKNAFAVIKEAKKTITETIISAFEKCLTYIM